MDFCVTIYCTLSAFFIYFICFLHCVSSVIVWPWSAPWFFILLWWCRINSYAIIINIATCLPSFNTWHHFLDHVFHIPFQWIYPCGENVSKLVFSYYQLVLSIQVKNEAAVLGFVGAPFTLASYVVEGGSSKHFSKIKNMAFSQPKVISGIAYWVSSSIHFSKIKKWFSFNRSYFLWCF